MNEQEELEQIRQALKEANAESAGHRHKVKELEQQLAEAAETTARVSGQLLQVQVNSALADSGITNTKVVKLIDLEQIQLDDDGNLTGLDGQVESIKTEFPEFFESRRAPKVEAADRPAIVRPKSSAEKLLNKAL